MLTEMETAQREDEASSYTSGSAMLRDLEATAILDPDPRSSRPGDIRPGSWTDPWTHHPPPLARPKEQPQDGGRDIARLDCQVSS